MPILRPPPPASSDRCTRSDGLQRCKNLRLRSKPFCRHHLPIRSPKTKKKKSRVRVSDSVSVKVSSPTITDQLRQIDPPRFPNPGEIWALGYESDGIPRHYALIERVDPADSTAEIMPLDFHPISDGDFAAVNSKLPISCGIYRAGSSMIKKGISALCQRIGHHEDFKVSGSKSFYGIFPKKGEIWAIYRECNGSERTPLFRIVEVLEGFTEKKGVVAVELEEAKGLKVEFQRQQHECSDAVVKFSKMELLLFSHRVSGLALASNGGIGGCREA